MTAYHPLDGYDIGYTVTVVDSVSTIIKTQHYDFIAGVDNVVSIVSVSYTHLDVYKRQILGLLKDQFKDIEENMVIILKYCCK